VAVVHRWAVVDKLKKMALATEADSILIVDVVPLLAAVEVDCRDQLAVGRGTAVEVVAGGIA
jgi:hypothetical protein